MRLVRVLAAVFFLVSGFCGLLYQIVWLRLAFASFGIITPVLSVVVSVFMLGLGLGSWWAGGWARRWPRATGLPAVAFYALCELLIGVGAFAVPRLFHLGERWMLDQGQTDSLAYLAGSAVWITVALLPWCILMGTTFPWMIAFLREVDPRERHGFSYLYTANVVGALLGTALTAFVLVELYGFRGTLRIGAVLNFLVAALASALAWRHRGRPVATIAAPQAAAPAAPAPARAPVFAVLLFATGFCSMGMEVAWTRAYTVVLDTTVYAFASLLFVYLLATWVGAALYRRALRRGRVAATANLVAALAAVACLPIVLNDPRLGSSAARVFAGIFPLCAVLGYLTPKLVDSYSFGEPGRAGRAYAVNIAGCILGPLVMSYGLLPFWSARWAMVLVALPLLAALLLEMREPVPHLLARRAAAAAGVALLAVSALVCTSFEEGGYLRGTDAIVRRDATATVISHSRGGRKRLVVNGVGMTSLVPVTKYMAHLPLGLHGRQPRSALVICFGMGTSYRSSLSWGVQTTAVELVPSVKEAFPYYFDDAEQVLADPRGRVIIDDGRRFLQRTEQSFDVVILDAPPPVEAAGSSLLYSSEMYELIRRRLAPGGVVQQWYPGSEVEPDQSLRVLRDGHGWPATLYAVARSFREAFPHVLVLQAEQGTGWHLLGSMEPIRRPSVEEFVARLPDGARRDMTEWLASGTLEAVVSRILAPEVPIDSLLLSDERIRVTDDTPYNEYYLLRRHWPALVRR